MSKQELITIFLPRFNVTVGSMLIRDVMSDSFYINGAVPPSGNVVLSHIIERTVKGKNFIFSVSDSIFPEAKKDTPAHRFSVMIKEAHNKILSASKANHKIVLEEFITQANGKMRSYSQDGSYGSSFALLSINDGVATMVNAGDVRGYAFRDNLLIPLTKSHVYDKLFAGAAGNDDSLTDDKPTKYVGCAFGGDSILPYFSDSVPVDVDDVFLICSNGLTDIISEERIEYILSLDISDEKIVHRLISEAVAGGADDNVTVMLLRNGGKPVKSNKSMIKGVARLAVLVIILAVITAFIASMFRGCSEKPVIEEETSSSNITTTEPEKEDFATSEQNIPSDDEFILRGTSPVE